MTDAPMLSIGEKWSLSFLRKGVLKKPIWVIARRPRPSVGDDAAIFRPIDELRSPRPDMVGARDDKETFFNRPESRNPEYPDAGRSGHAAAFLRVTACCDLNCMRHQGKP
jgi:hypothetical protein